MLRNLLLLLVVVVNAAVAHQCWTLWDSLVTPRANSCSALVLQTAYLVGGQQNGVSATKDMVSISIDNPLQWDPTSPDMPTPMAGAFCSYHGDRLYISSGPSIPNELLVERPSVWYLDVDKDEPKWTSLGTAPTARKLSAIGASFIPPMVFMFGGTDGVNPILSVDFHNDSKATWETLPSEAQMPYPGCNCHTVGHHGEIILVCRECNASAPSVDTPVTFNVMRFVTHTLTFAPTVWSYSVNGSFQSTTCQSMAQYVLCMVSFDGLADPVMFYTNLYTGETTEIGTGYIAESRAFGSLVPLENCLLYAGGISTSGSISAKVDVVPAFPETVVSLNNMNRTYKKGDNIIAKTLSCPVGLTIRLATTPRCDIRAPGTRDASCVPSAGESFTYIPTTEAVDAGFICVSLGLCPSAQNVNRSLCTNTGQGTNDVFENCLFNGCCWDNKAQQCYKYVDGPNENKYFMNVDADPVIITGPHHGSNVSAFAKFLASPIGIVILVAVAGAFLIAILMLGSRLLRSGNNEEGSAHPLDQHSRYRVLCKLGQGGFGTVFLVARKSDGAKFALKYIVCKDEEERDYAIKEFELIRSAQGHENMIAMVDMFMNWSENAEFASPLKKSQSGMSGTSDDSIQSKATRSTSELSPLLQLAPKYVCIVMDYCAEGDMCHYILRQKLSGNLVPERMILQVFAKQCCSLLMHLHALEPPIVHRDLKPENILLQDNGEKIIVTDFGLAQQVEKSFMTTRAGSLHYVAPECWKRHYTVAVDNWAVGCIMYGACTGRVTPDTARVMFSDARERNFADDIRSDLRDYSPKLQRIVLGLLTPDPSKRWTSAQVLEEIDRED